MGTGILDRVVFPAEIKESNPLPTRLHKLAHFQVLKLGSSPNLYKLSHGDLLPWSGSFSQLLPACGARPEFSSWLQFRLRFLGAFHIPHRREQAGSDTSE